MSSSEPKWTLAQTFYGGFHASASELASRLDTLKSSPDIPPTAIQAVTSDLSRLTKSLSDATGSLPSYDQRQCELKLKTMEKSIEELRGPSVGIPKFSFKRTATKPKSSTGTSVVGSSLTKPRSTLTQPEKTSHRYLTVLDVRPPNSSTEVSISDLDNCIVNLLPGDQDHVQINALHVQRVSRSILLLPQITGSIILHDLSVCVIAVGCHQFRMHDSTAVDVYLENGSDAIIEHCSDIQFAAYPSSLAGEETTTGKSFSVKDFSHILPTPSPNWSLLPEEARENSWPVFALQDQALRDQLERMLSANSK